MALPNQRGAEGNLPPQFRPQSLQPRQKPIVPNLKSIGGLDHHAGVSHRGIGHNREVQRRTPNLPGNFSRQPGAKGGGISSGDFQDKIIARKPPNCFDGKHDDRFVAV